MCLLIAEQKHEKEQEKEKQPRKAHELAIDPPHKVDSYSGCPTLAKMPFFSRVFRSKDSNATKKQAKPTAAVDPVPAKPKWTDAWQRPEVAPEEVQDLIRGCAQELKARGRWNSIPNHVVVLRLPRAFFRLLIIRRS